MTPQTRIACNSQHRQTQRLPSSFLNTDGGEGEQKQNRKPQDGGPSPRRPLSLSLVLFIHVHQSCVPNSPYSPCVKMTMMHCHLVWQSERKGETSRGGARQRGRDPKRKGKGETSRGGARQRGRDPKRKKRESKSTGRCAMQRERERENRARHTFIKAQREIPTLADVQLSGSVWKDSGKNSNCIVLKEYLEWRG
jgi:hypothetical protein